jgi:putative two-component system response regulator
MHPAASRNPCILIIEDQAVQRHLLESQLQAQGYDVVATAGGQEGLAVLHSRPDIRMVITDLSMPDMDGVAVVQAIRARQQRYTYVMVLTGNDDKESLLRALAAGADDFVTKPILPEELQLRLQAANRQLRLEDQDKLVGGLAELAAVRAGEEARNVQRMKRYCLMLAEDLRQHQPHLGLTRQIIEDIASASVLHDIGMICVPESLLNKRGRLNAKEMQLVREHAVEGGDMLRALYEENGSPYLLLAFEIASSHHERWDGSGYPQGLQGEDIPLAGRIVALTDTYNVLRSRRPYKDPMPANHTEQVIIAERGKHFDPQLVDSFIRVKEQFAAVHEQLRDPSESW